MNRFSLTLVPMFAASLLASAAQATTVNLAYSNGLLLNTAGISTLDVSGADMIGLGVTACFTAAPCQALTWGSTSLTAGGVAGAGWSLTLNGNSFTQRFVLQVTSSALTLSSLTLDGRPALTTFDINPSVVLSPDSGLGRAFDLLDGPDAGVVSAIDVVYSNKLAVQGFFYDDLYTLMTLNFTGGTGFTAGDRMEFMADTDQTANSTPIVPVNGVPTPGTLTLVGLALLGLARQARRKAQA